MCISKSPDPSYIKSFTKNPPLKPVGLFSTFEISSLYEGDNIFKSEFILSGSEYPNGPYIGFPSYAQPIIGECEVISLKSPLFLVVKLFSRVLAISCE